MARLLISYRREDTAGHAGRLYDILAEHFGNDQVFRDVDTIAPGDDFVQIIENYVGSADVLIALIGRDWISIKNDDGRRRLDDPDDFVRLELAKALERKIRVVPVLVQGATMPTAKDLPEPLQSLARRNAFIIGDQAFRRDASALIDALNRTLTPMAKPSAVGKSVFLSKRSLVVMAAALVTVAVGITAVRQFARQDERKSGPQDSPGPPRATPAERPTSTEPAKSEPAKPALVKSEPAKPEPVKPAPPSTEAVTPQVPPVVDTPPAPKLAAVPVVEPPRPPIVIYPTDGSTIPQPFTRPWLFRWEPARPGQAATYEVTLGKERMTREPWQVTTRATSWQPGICGIGGPAVNDWWLQVKSRLEDGSVTETKVRFNIERTDIASLCRACPTNALGVGVDCAARDPGPPPPSGSTARPPTPPSSSPPRPPTLPTPPTLLTPPTPPRGP